MWPMPFNNFFIIVTEKLNIQQIEKGDAIFILKDSFPGKFPSIIIIPINEAEIKGILHSLKPHQSSGYDEITSKISKACASVSSHPSSYVYNYLLYTGIFLTVLKLQ